jgi:uncharacterized protein involved in propanediol utilization
MPNTCEILMFDRTIKERNSSRLQVLVARFEKAIQTHDARLAASAATLAALSWNIQERSIGREAPAAENAATDTCPFFRDFSRLGYRWLSAGVTP